MLRIAVSTAIALLAVAPALAQSIGEPIPGRAGPRASYGKPAAAPQSGTRPCPEYGAGFVRIEGSSFCVRAGGAVRAEFGKSSSNGYRGHRSGFGSRTDGMVYVETRGQSAVGPVRSVLSVRGSVDRGLDSGPFRY